MLTLLSEAHKNRRGRPGTGEEKREACQLPRTVWGGSKMPNVAGWPASCQEGFGGGPQCLTLLSEAHKKRRGRPGTGQEKRQACQGFEGGLKCLTLLSEAHQKRRGSARAARSRGSLPRLPPDAGKAAMQE